MSVLSYYRTINMYDRLIMSVACSSLKEGFRREYEAWHKLNRALNGFMFDYTYAGASYSSLPMDVNGMADYRSCKRYEELVVEEAVLVYDKPFKSDSTVISLKKVNTLLMPFDDMELEDVIAELGADFESTEWVRERFGECLDMQAVREHAVDIRTGIRNWMTERERIADRLPESQRNTKVIKTLISIIFLTASLFFAACDNRVEDGIDKDPIILGKRYFHIEAKGGKLETKIIESFFWYEAASRETLSDTVRFLEEKMAHRGLFTKYHRDDTIVFENLRLWTDGKKLKAEFGPNDLDMEKDSYSRFEKKIDLKT